MLFNWVHKYTPYDIAPDLTARSFFMKLSAFSFQPFENGKDCADNRNNEDDNNKPFYDR